MRRWEGRRTCGGIAQFVHHFLDEGIGLGAEGGDGCRGYRGWDWCRRQGVGNRMRAAYPCCLIRLFASRQIHLAKLILDLTACDFFIIPQHAELGASFLRGPKNIGFIGSRCSGYQM